MHNYRQIFEINGLTKKIETHSIIPFVYNISYNTVKEEELE